MGAAQVVPAVRISKTNIDEIRRLQETLVRAHWQEVALHKRLMVLDPDWQTYYQLEEKGLLHVLVAWQPEGENKGKIVGYSVNIKVPRHLHYRGLCVLQNDVVYVDPSCRGRRVFEKLREATELLGREVGARMVFWHGKKDQALAKILSRTPGYGVQDVIFSKEL